MTKESICLVGNPNVGKTTYFNMLTASFEHTGNYHGVTVDKKEKLISNENKSYNVVDLPGIYSLSSYSPEEQVSIDYLLSTSPYIINVCDVNLLHRNLYLTLQLLEAGFKPLLLLNFVDETKKHGIRYDYRKLSSILGIKILQNIYKNRKDVQKDVFNYSFENNTNALNLPYLEKLPIKQIIAELSIEQRRKYQNREKFIAIKILEQDENIVNDLNLTENQRKRIDMMLCQKDYLTYIAKLRYEYIDYLIKECKGKTKEYVYGKFWLDKIVLNKYLCLPIFFCIIFLIFFVTFSSLGSFLSECLKFIIDKYLGVPLTNLLIRINAPSWIVGLFSSGIIGGVGGLVSFIPQVVLLFFFLSVMEDSGYISRLSFCLEDLFSKFGLSGKSIFTLLMSFGCTTSSILTARTIEDKNTRIKTVIASPYMSCSAKLPIYAVIGGAFFGKGNILIIVLMYLLGIIVSLILSSFLSKSLLKSGEKSFILEFPPYRIPSFKRIIAIIAQNCKSFIVKVSTILLSFSVIVWILQNFSLKFEYIPLFPQSKSILQVVGTILAPIFAPIGLDSWGIVVSLIVGVMAKEMIVGTMAIINKVPSSSDFNSQLGQTFLSSSFVINFSPKTALVMMVFSLLYLPCISTIAVMKKEIGSKWTMFACLIQFAIAYSVCFIIYSIMTRGILAQILISLVLILLIISLLIKTFKKKGTCYNCLGCVYKCKKN